MASRPNSFYAYAPLSKTSDDIYIAVMGITGVGKSTFISKCCHQAGVGVGHSLKSGKSRPCVALLSPLIGFMTETKEVQIFNFTHNGKRIHLIDTPGFDDTFRTDSDVLQDLAYWLTTSYKDMHIKLAGIIYLHRISDPRMTGHAYKNLRTFRKLCGKQSMSSVVLATTMWEQVDPTDGDTRELELRSTAEFWGDMIREGSTMMRHLNDYNSAMNIILLLLNKQSTTVLGLQVEMVDLKKPLDETEAGREVDSELTKQREIFERRLKRTEEELLEALSQNDQRHAEDLARDQEKLQTQIKQSKKGQEDLRINLERLIKEKEAQHEQLRQEMDAKIEKQAEDLRKKEEQFAAFKNRIQDREEQHEKERIEREKELKKAKERIDQGDEATVAMLLAAYEQLLQAEDHEARAKEARQREAAERKKRIEAEMRAEEHSLALLQQAQQQGASYQQACLLQQQYEQAWQQHYYQQQQMGQIAAGTVLGGTAGLAAAGLMCSVM